MVFDPKRPRPMPQVIPNSYIISTDLDADFNDVVKAVDALIKKEGREKDVTWVNKMDAIGVAVINCDEAFADKIKALPGVGAVEQERTVHIQNKKPKFKGPSF